METGTAQSALDCAAVALLYPLSAQQLPVLHQCVNDAVAAHVGPRAATLFARKAQLAEQLATAEARGALPPQELAMMDVLPFDGSLSATECAAKEAAHRETRLANRQPCPCCDGKDGERLKKVEAAKAEKRAHAGEIQLSRGARDVWGDEPAPAALLQGGGAAQSAAACGSTGAQRAGTQRQSTSAPGKENAGRAAAANASAAPQAAADQPSAGAVDGKGSVAQTGTAAGKGASGGKQKSKGRRKGGRRKGVNTAQLD